MKRTHAQQHPGANFLPAACLPRRYHWPKHVDVRVNQLPYRPYSRNFNAPMGINQRDEAASLGAWGGGGMSMPVCDCLSWACAVVPCVGGPHVRRG